MQHRTRREAATALLLFIRSCSFMWRVSLCCADVSSPDFLSKLQAQPELLRGLADPRSEQREHTYAASTLTPFDELIEAAMIVLAGAV